MNLDVELIRSEENYEGALVFVVVWRLGLAESLHEAIVLMKSGAVLMDGRVIRDLNARLPKCASIVVGLRGVELGASA